MTKEHVKFEQAVKDYHKSIEAAEIKFRPLLPSVQLECLPNSQEPVDVYLGEWNGTSFTETLLKTVKPAKRSSKSCPRLN